MEIQDTGNSSDLSTDTELPSEGEDSRGRVVTSSDEISDTSIETDARRISKYCSVAYNTESEDEIVTDDIQDIEWISPSGKQPSLVPYTGTSGLKSLENVSYKEENFYLLLVTEEMFQEIAEQTNLYATQILSRKQSCRLNKWIPTNKNEIKRLFGLLIWMGIVKLPEIHLYWSRDPIFAQSFPQSIMSRNRFEILLRMLHFANNENANLEDRLYKIKSITDKLSENYAKYYDAPEVICINESVIPFHSYASFSQYTKQKQRKYGIRICKLCFKPGYTYSFEICCDKNSKKKSTPKSIATSLCKNMFDKGHTLCIDDRYTSIDLAEEFIRRNTHVIGTILSNCPGISKDVVQKKLQRGEIFAKENKSGITLMKWKDKHDVLLLSTKHSTETIVIRKNGYNIVKPTLVIDYNEGRRSVDSFKHMTKYSSPLCGSLKWYKKVIFELLLNTSIVNAWILYNTQQYKSVSMVEFMQRLVTYLCHCQDGSNGLSLEIKTNLGKRHEIKEREGKVSTSRKRCISCYKKNVKKFGTTGARQKTIRIVTFCSDCPNQPCLCIPCFNKIHRNL